MRQRARLCPAMEECELKPANQDWLAHTFRILGEGEMVDGPALKDRQHRYIKQHWAGSSVVMVKQLLRSWCDAVGKAANCTKEGSGYVRKDADSGKFYLNVHHKDVKSGRARRLFAEAEVGACRVLGV